MQDVKQSNRFSNTLTILVMFVIGSDMLHGQLREDLRNEILVYITPGALELPPDERGEIALADLIVSDWDLHQALQRIEATTIASAFPDFPDRDTLRVSPAGNVVKLPQFSRIFRVQVRQIANLDTAIAVLNRQPAVLFAERHMDAYPGVNDADYWRQWHLNNTGQAGGVFGADIDAEAAWAIYTGSPSIKIGVIDTGVDGNHDDLSGKTTGDANDPNYNVHAHGTHVAGIAAGKHNNSGNIKGVDASAQIISRRIFETGGYVGDATAATQIISAVDAGAHILNNSWGGIDYSTTVRRAFAYAYKMNRVTVAIMHNYYESDNPIIYPAAFGQGIIAVGATNNNDAWSVFSGARNYIDVTAPGGENYVTGSEDIYSAIPTNSYAFMAGTSQAAPQVSGIAALLIGYAQENLGVTLYNDDVEQIIKLSTEQVPGMGGQNWTPEYGTGRVNARQALDFIRLPNVIQQWTATGGSSVSSSGQYNMVFYDTPGLLQIVYVVNRWEIQKTISFPQAFSSPPEAWGRGVATTGYSSDSPNFGMGWSEVVPGSVTATGATLRTYVYEVWKMLPGLPPPLEYLGYFPTTPSNVVFAYTVLEAIPENLTLTNLSIADTRVYIATNTITAGPAFTVESGGDVTFKAGASITLKPGFIATAGSNFHAYIDTSLGGGGLQNFVSAGAGAESAGNDAQLAEEQNVSNPLIPEEFSLSTNYPNPFNPSTTIRFGLPVATDVTFIIYDLMGREVDRLADSHRAAGYYQLVWQGRDTRGKSMSSGIYIARLVTPQYIKSIKMVLIK